MKLTPQIIDAVGEVINREADRRFVTIGEILHHSQTYDVTQARNAAIQSVYRDFPSLTLGQLGQIFNRPAARIKIILAEVKLAERPAVRVVHTLAKPADVINFRKPAHPPMSPLLPRIPDRREYVQRGVDVTASFFGDPAPGRSALDQKRAGL